jgi:cell volume regulation protein A
MSEIGDFGAAILAVSAAVFVALLGMRLADRISLPYAAVFLAGAVLLGELVPSAEQLLSIKEVERIAVVALIVILFHGGLHIGPRRFRGSAGPILALGIVGTFVTAGVIALAAHYVLGFDWIEAGLIGAAIAPTDPAVTFSVCGAREVRGRSGTILEGEAGMNDPVGIALMIGMIDVATKSHAEYGSVALEFVVELAVGLAIGLAGGLAETWLLRNLSLPNLGLHAVRTLGMAAVVYGVATVAHGSGFLAVFIAGMLVGDADAPRKQEIELFQNALSNVAEIVVFGILGVTITLGAIDLGRWAEGLALAAFLAVVARPLVVGALLVPVRLRLGERLFVMWSGLKGAVPILLAAFALLGGVREGQRLYDVVFIVVAFSVIVQGATIPWAAARLGIPMHRQDAEPPERMQKV